MYQNHIFTDINEALPELMSRLLSTSTPELTSRNGVVKELIHVGITLQNPTSRELILPHRKANLAAQIAETAWVLRGRNDVEWLSHYLPRAKDFSDDGETWRGGYGPRIRHWRLFPGQVIDQLQHVVDLLRRDPTTRQAVISIYDPAIDTEPGKDIPCNNWLSFTSRLGALDLHVAIRSNDIMWGWSGINAFEWSVLQEIVARMVGVGIGSLHFSTTSLHLYDQHWSKAEKIVSGSAGVLPKAYPKTTPRFNATGIDNTDSLDVMLDHWFTIEEAIRTESEWMDAPAYLGQDRVRTDAAVDQFPEPMFQSWLRVLQWWWTGDMDYLESLKGTRLEHAVQMSLQPPDRIKFARHDHCDCQAAPSWGRPSDIFDVDEYRRSQRNRSNGTRESIKDQRKKIEEFCMDLINRGESTTVQGSARQMDQVANENDFVQYVTALHNEKHAAYGDSWKRRGEMVGILANIARKIDRIGGGETAGETSTDTAIDLLVYLAKYRVWLDDQLNGTNWSEGTDAPNAAIRQAAHDNLFAPRPNTLDGALEWFSTHFDLLSEAAHKRDRNQSIRIVANMFRFAYVMAQRLWNMEQRGVVDPMAENGEYRGADVD